MDGPGAKRRRLIAVLLGFSLFGALFAATYYQPDASAGEERDNEMRPMHRLGPGEMQPEFIEPGTEGEEVHINLTVLQGGPLDVYVMDIENIALRALNGTTYSFHLDEDVRYDEELSRSNISTYYNFTLTLDGENRTALLIASSLDPATVAPGETNVTEVAIDSWYPETETQSLVTAYLMASPSVLLVGYVTYRRFKD